MARRSTFLIATALGLSLGVGLAGPALPQAVPQASSGPVAFSALDGSLNETGAELIGQAEIVQGTNRLRADRISAVRGANGGLQRAEATGTVYFVTPNENLRGDRAVYTPGDDQVVITGDVVMTQGRNVLTGNRVVYNVSTGAARIEGGGGTGRVQGVFYPEGSN